MNDGQSRDAGSEFQMWATASLTRENAPPAGRTMSYWCIWSDSGQTYFDQKIVFPGYDAWAGITTPTPAQAAAAQLAKFEQRLPLPTVRAWPTLDRQVVGIETWFRIDTFGTADEPIDALGVVGNMHAQPNRTEFRIGGELVDTCVGAGRVWEDGLNSDLDKTDCGHSFHRSYPPGTELTVSVIYDMSWAASTGDGGPLGEVTRTAVFPMHVRSYEAIIR